ncbi:MAG: hypothetical protein ACNA8W_01190 [Bradymonadaceae bacterium]
MLAVGRATDTEGKAFPSIHVSNDGAATWHAEVLPFIGFPTSMAVANDNALFGVIGLEGGRGLLVTRTGGM